MDPSIARARSVFLLKPKNGQQTWALWAILSPRMRDSVLWERDLFIGLIVAVKDSLAVVLALDEEANGFSVGRRRVKRFNLYIRLVNILFRS